MLTVTVPVTVTVLGTTEKAGIIKLCRTSRQKNWKHDVARINLVARPAHAKLRMPLPNLKRRTPSPSRARRPSPPPGPSPLCLSTIRAGGPGQVTVATN